MWENQERNKQPLSFARFNTEDYAHLRGRSVLHPKSIDELIS